MCSSQIENDHKLRNVLDECVGRIDLRNEQESEHPGLYWSMPGTIARYSFTQRKKNAPRKGFPNLLRYPRDVAQQGPHAVYVYRSLASTKENWKQRVPGNGTMRRL